MKNFNDELEEVKSFEELLQEQIEKEDKRIKLDNTIEEAYQRILQERKHRKNNRLGNIDTDIKVCRTIRVDELFLEALKFIIENPNCTAHDLIIKIEVHPARIARLIGQLARNGFIESEKDKNIFSLITMEEYNEIFGLNFNQ